MNCPRCGLSGYYDPKSPAKEQIPNRQDWPMPTTSNGPISRMPAKEQPGEQNAAPQGGSPSNAFVLMDGPAAAAPDVAAMVKRLRDACIDYDGSQEVDAAQAVHHPTCGMLREAAALL